MKLTLVFVAIAVVATPALALEGPERAYSRATVALKEGKFEEAAERFEVVIREWPDDDEFTPKAYHQLAVCLARMGKAEKALYVIEKGAGRYGESEEWMKHARALADRIRKHHDARKGERVRLDEIERKLKEKGLRGEELRRAFEEEKRRLNAEKDAHGRERDVDRLVELWKEQGVPEEEIHARLRRVKEEHARQQAIRQELKRFAEQLREEGLPEEEVRRRLADHHRELMEGEEGRWRERHGDEMEDARRQFIHLAERLGIPPEAAERFLEEHAGRRHFYEPRDASGDPDRRRAPREDRGIEVRVRELEEKIAALHEKLAPFLRELEERLEGLDRELGEAHEGVERELGESHERLEREIADRMEGLEREVAERLEGLEREIGGFLEKLVDRIERLEERLPKKKERRRAK
ncbi:MAG: tetratricopeptide repeat protein [Planctomycetota bacterium]|jgi:hypothetical protein